jgi:TusA-related sulfurtransferase
MKTIDTSGMSCPQPVLATKKAMEENPDGVMIMVDNTTSKENVQRFMLKNGYQVTVEKIDEAFVLTAKK